MTIQTDARSSPTCAKCGKVMTPQNARVRPELFLCDECLPEELRSKREPDMTIEQALAIVDRKLESARIWVPVSADLTGAVDMLRRVCKAMARIADVEDSLL